MKHFESLRFRLNIFNTKSFIIFTFIFYTEVFSPIAANFFAINYLNASILELNK